MTINLIPPRQTPVLDKIPNVVGIEEILGAKSNAATVVELENCHGIYTSTHTVRKAREQLGLKPFVEIRQSHSLGRDWAPAKAPDVRPIKVFEDIGSDALAREARSPAFNRLFQRTPGTLIGPFARIGP